VNNIEMDLGEIEWDSVDCIAIVQDREKWRAFVNASINLWVLCNAWSVSSGCTTGGLSGSAQLHRVSLGR
jgi:hypothetical protein